MLIYNCTTENSKQLVTQYTILNSVLIHNLFVHQTLFKIHLSPLIVVDKTNYIF